MTKLPEKLVLQATRTSAFFALIVLMFFTLIICLPWMVGGKYAIPSSIFEMIAVTSSLGALMVATCLGIFHPGKLELHHHHFVMVGLFGSTTRNWSDVSAFRVFRDIGFEKKIKFYPIEVDGMQGLAKKIARVRGMRQIETYGMEASDLADLLNSFREQAINDGK